MPYSTQTGPFGATFRAASESMSMSMVRDEELLKAVKGSRIGRVLRKLGYVTREQFHEALQLQEGEHKGMRGGEILMILAMVSWNVYSLKAQQWLGHLGQARLTLVSSVSTCLWLASIMGLMLALGVARWPAQTPPLDAFAMVFYLALFSAAVGNILWNFGVSVVGLPVSSLYINLSAVFAVLIAVAFGFEPTWWQVLGGSIVMAGVLYMQLRKLQAARA